MTLSREDRQLQRYLDGELPEPEAAAFAARLLADQALRERADEFERVRGGFAAARVASEGVRAPAGFTANLLAEVRRLPERDQLEQEDIRDNTIRICRRLFLAALLLFGVGLAWHSGLLDRDRATSVEAAPDQEIRDLMDRLDAKVVESMEGEPRRGPK